MKKNSSGIQSTQLLKNLQKALTTKEASVTYVFVEKRSIGIHSEDIKDEERISRLHVNLPIESLTDKTPNELLKMLETTRWDLGANYFILS